MTIRPITLSDVPSFYTMLCHLDAETDYMLLEAGEREAKTKDLSRLTAMVSATIEGDDRLLVAVDNSEGAGGAGENIVGFIWAERGSANRTRHSAYIVVGIREGYRNQGIGTEFFKRLDAWAREQGIIRLELTVVAKNEIAKHLYEKSGFVVEGTKVKSMKINGELVDEYYMGKIVE